MDINTDPVVDLEIMSGHSDDVTSSDATSRENNAENDANAQTGLFNEASLVVLSENRTMAAEKDADDPTESGDNYRTPGRLRTHHGNSAKSSSSQASIPSTLPNADAYSRDSLVQYARCKLSKLGEVRLGILALTFE